MGPVSTTSLMMAQVLAAFEADDRLEAAHGLAFFCGILCFCLEYFKLEFMENMLSLPVVTAMISGIGARVCVEEIAAVLQVEMGAGESVFTKLWGIGQNIGDLNVYSTIMGCSAIVFLIFMHTLKQKLKSKSIIFNIASLMIVIVTTVICLTTDFAKEQSINLVGKLPHHLGFGLPNFKMMF